MLLCCDAWEFLAPVILALVNNGNSSTTELPCSGAAVMNPRKTPKATLVPRLAGHPACHRLVQSGYLRGQWKPTRVATSTQCPRELSVSTANRPGAVKGFAMRPTWHQLSQSALFVTETNGFGAPSGASFLRFRAIQDRNHLGGALQPCGNEARNFETPQLCSSFCQKLTSCHCSPATPN